MPLEGSSVQFYRDEARRIRGLAEASDFPDTKQQLLMIAGQYDRLAAQHEQGLRRTAQKWGPLPPEIIKPAMDYWERIRAAHPMPRRGDLDPVDIPKLLPFVMLVDVFPDPLDFKFRLIGTEIDAIVSENYLGRRFSAIRHMTLGNKIWSDYEAVVRARRPFTAAVNYVGTDRYVRGIRHCLMPLSEDGKTVTMVLAAVEIERR